MQAVRQEKTSPERKLAGIFDKNSLSYLQNVADILGKPDFYFPELDLVIFVHGCFWHGHSGCRKGRSRPKSNARYWKEKIERNQNRDRKISRQLRHLGYSVFTVWECELAGNRIPQRLISRIGLAMPEGN